MDMKPILICLGFLAMGSCDLAMAQQAPCVPPGTATVATRYGNPAHATGSIAVSRGVYVIPPVPVCAAPCGGADWTPYGQTCMPTTRGIAATRWTWLEPVALPYRRQPADASGQVPATGSSG